MLDIIAQQEAALQFATFDKAEAWRLGVALKEAAEAAGQVVAIDITVAGHGWFHYAMPGTSPDNADWVRRKRNVVAHFGRSSYAIGLELKEKGTTLPERNGLPIRDYAPFGGSFPLTLRSVGVIGQITVSGLPQREDHALIVRVLSAFLNVAAPELS